MIEYGVHVVRRKITAHNIESSELSEPVIENLIERLKAVPWRGPENNWSPMFWDFHFTDPMVQILEAGPRAQDVLLCHIGDQKIQDQVIMLLGGIGDEHAIGPIIDTLTDGNLSMDPRSRRLNVIGDLALTNLTVSEVIWFHGGGPPHNYCPDSPKSCWTKWWLEHKASFKVGVEGDRLYVNYPNYGIYQQFGDTSRP